MLRLKTMHLWVVIIAVSAVLAVLVLGGCSSGLKAGGDYDEGNDPGTQSAGSGQGARTIVGVAKSVDPALLKPEVQFGDATAVVVGMVTEILPMQRNAAGSMGPGEGMEEVLPIYYAGFRMSVDKWNGKGLLNEEITVYYEGSGPITVDGVEYQYVVEMSPTITEGGVYIVPIRESNYYGVPLEPGEFWAVSDGMAIYEAHGNKAVRVVPIQDFAPPAARVTDASTVDELLSIAESVGLRAQAKQ